MPSYPPSLPPNTVLPMTTNALGSELALKKKKKIFVKIVKQNLSTEIPEYKKKLSRVVTPGSVLLSAK